MKLTSKNELKIKLTEEQRKQIVEFIANTGNAKIDMEVVFEVDVKKSAIAPAAVLIGMAV